MPKIKMEIFILLERILMGSLVLLDRMHTRNESQLRWDYQGLHPHNSSLVEKNTVQSYPPQELSGLGDMETMDNLATEIKTV